MREHKYRAWDLDNQVMYYSGEEEDMGRRTKMSKKTLIVLIGLPLSGKSTWALAESKGHNIPIVCPDSIRLAMHGKRFVKEAEPYVWAVAITMVKALFISGHNRIIVDATNTTKKRRDFWESDSWKVAYHCFFTSKEQCIERAIANNDTEIIPIIEKMSEQFEKLEADEVDKDSKIFF